MKDKKNPIDFTYERYFSIYKKLNIIIIIKKC